MWAPLFPFRPVSDYDPSREIGGMTVAEGVAIGLGFLAIVAPEFWPKMPKSLSYSIAGIGICWLAYSLILAIENGSGMKLQYGPLAAIIVGVVFIAGGIFWHISRLDNQPATSGGHGPAASPTHPPATSHASVPPPATPVARELVSRTPRQLLALYEGKTPFQADKLIDPFKGLWIEAESRVLNILPDGPGRSIVVLRDEKDTIECRFGPQWANAIGRLDIGETLRVRGKISDNQNGQQLYLLDCEVVPATRTERPVVPAPSIVQPQAKTDSTPTVAAMLARRSKLEEALPALQNLKTETERLVEAQKTYWATPAPIDPPTNRHARQEIDLKQVWSMHIRDIQRAITDVFPEGKPNLESPPENVPLRKVPGQDAIADQFAAHQYGIITHHSYKVRSVLQSVISSAENEIKELTENIRKSPEAGRPFKN